MSWMVEEINHRGGSISFRDYMDLALYHPDHGYYSSEAPRYGRSGDFLTAPSASSWYARVFARMLRNLAAASGPMALVDVGAGDGSFIGGVIDAIGGDVTAVVGSVLTFERSQTMLRIQRANLRHLGIPWRSLDDVSRIESADSPVVVHASELYDAMPVHRVVMGADGLCELWVGVRDGCLEWRRVRARSELEDYFRDHGVDLQPGQIAELSLEWRTAQRDLLTRFPGGGLALVLEYGYPAARLYNPRGRGGGSLSCYRDHRLSRDPLVEPGLFDITAHVNVDDLRTAASEAGWAEVGWWPLAEFLGRAGIANEVSERGVGEEAELTADVITERQEIKRLLDPDGMGSDLRMLVQGRGEMGEFAREVLTE